MTDGADDQRFLIKGAAELSDYLASPVLFWPLRSESQPLTIGNLLLAQKKVAALFVENLPANVRSAYSLIDGARADRPVAWQKKAEADLHSRMNQYRTLVAEMDEGGYGVTARLRTVLELLLKEVPEHPEIQILLSGLDHQLRNWLEPGEFIWPAMYQSSFPKVSFWFLYGKPRE